MQGGNWFPESAAVGGGGSDVTRGSHTLPLFTDLFGSLNATLQLHSLILAKGC